MAFIILHQVKTYTDPLGSPVLVNTHHLTEVYVQRFPRQGEGPAGAALDLRTIGGSSVTVLPVDEKGQPLLPAQSGVHSSAQLLEMFVQAGRR